MLDRPGLRASAAALVAPVLMAGCGGASDPKGSPPEPETIADWCRSQVLPNAELESMSFNEDGTTIPAVAVRPSDTPQAVAVLLPQTSGGLCGWLPYAAHLAAQGVLAVPMDLCGFGNATCTDPTPPIEAQVDGVLALIETTDLEVTLIGASMGGSQTVRAVARGAAVDAWVDVSGPSVWDGDELIDLAPQISTPGLVVYARSDGDSEFVQGRQLARASGALFHEAPSGHGWELVMKGDGASPTRAGTVIEDFVLGAR